MDGGKKTAGLLKQAVEERLLSSISSAAHRLQVVFHVYANVEGLAKTYKEMEILPDSASLNEFIRGFNMGDVMCNYVDAGDGKECADEKVKGMSTTCSLGEIFDNADFAKRLYDMTWRMSTICRFSLAVRPTAGTLVCLGHSPRIRHSVAVSLFLRVPHSPANWPTSRVILARWPSTIFSGDRS